MHKRIYFFQEQNLKILYIDLSHIIDPKIGMQRTKNVFELIEKTEGKFYILMNFKHALANFEITKYTTENRHIFEDKVYATAAIGASGVTKKMISFFSLFSKIKTKPFDSREEAINWLVKHSEKRIKMKKKERMN